MKSTISNGLLDFTIVHGRAVCSHLLYDNPNPLPEVNISEDIHIVTVVDRPGIGSMCVNKINFKQGGINLITVGKYKKWISKVEELKNYIKVNYSELPNYILYLDAFDTLILKDILNPQAYLDYYNAKILFNSEPAYYHTGFPHPEGTDINYYDSLYYQGKYTYKKLNKEKYNTPFENGLNAGVFLGQKDYVLELLEEAFSLMKDSPEKGFPYGCQDDQCVFRDLHNRYFDNISVDIFNNYFYWGCPETFKQPDSIYGINYFKNYKDEYDNRMASL